MDLPATFTKSSFPRWELAHLEKLRPFIGHPVPTTRTYAGITNAPMDPTTASQFMVVQHITKFDEYLLGAEDNSGWGISGLLSFVSHSDPSSLGDATVTHLHTLHSLSSLFCRTLDVPEAPLLSALVALPKSLWPPSQLIREEEEQETVYADTNRALSFKDLVSTLDRISRPTEIEDIPLPFDPDDYPVV